MKERKKSKKKAVVNPYKPGREWDREMVMDYLCTQIATSSRGMVTILSEGGAGGHALPMFGVVDRWLHEDAALRERYARAKEAQADYMADEIMAIADDGRNDWMQDDPGYRANGEHIQRSRLRVEARKWLAAKLKPKRYGERVDVAHSGGVEVVSKEQRDAAVAAAMASAPLQGEM